jgi:single-strand DNA-binding protein
MLKWTPADLLYHMDNLKIQIRKEVKQMLNQCTLTGNLGADPEVFYSSEGNPVATFNIAFHSSKKKTCWIKVTCFQKLAEVVQKYLHKGARIAVIGTLDQSRWETDEGIQRTSFHLIANTLEFIKTDGRGFEQGKEGEQPEDVPF